MRLLIVEDQALIALSLADVLTNAGHEIIGPASDSTTALALARHDAVEAAFVDVDLEESGAGLHLAHQLARLDIPVVFTTAQAALARESGTGIGLLEKPYDVLDAVDAVAAIQAYLAGTPRAASRSIELLAGSNRRPT